MSEGQGLDKTLDPQELLHIFRNKEILTNTLKECCVFQEFETITFLILGSKAVLVLTLPINVML